MQAKLYVLYLNTMHVCTTSAAYFKTYMCRCMYPMSMQCVCTNMTKTIEMQLCILHIYTKELGGRKERREGRNSLDRPDMWYYKLDYTLSLDCCIRESAFCTV